MIDDDACEPVGGMRIGRGNSTRRKPALVPRCPPQIPHELTWAQTRVAAMGIRMNLMLFLNKANSIKAAEISTGNLAIPISSYALHREPIHLSTIRY
jgi:hypothetical protein